MDSNYLIFSLDFFSIQERGSFLCFFMFSERGRFMSLENAKANLYEFAKELKLEGLDFDENNNCKLTLDNKNLKRLKVLKEEQDQSFSKKKDPEI